MLGRYGGEELFVLLEGTTELHFRGAKNNKSGAGNLRASLSVVVAA